MIETEIYRVGAGRYGRRVALRLASKWWLPLGAPVVASLIAGACDWRWWIVGLALILVLYPGILMLAYYYYALSPEAVRAILPQKAIVMPQEVTIVYYPMAEDSKSPQPRIIPMSEIKRVSIDGDYVDLQVGEQEIVEIPRSAFPQGSIFKAFPQLAQS